MGLANDVYAQIGLVMLVGLLGKNAILIVEFAVQRRRDGASLKEAAVEGAKLRFRPIQMTSFAFIAGLLPLVVATGAGAIGNRTIGSTGVGGMLVGTVIGVLVIPGLYYLFGQIDGGRKLLKDETNEPLSELFEHRAQETRVSDDLQHPPGAAALYAEAPSDRLKELRETGYSTPVHTVPENGK
jgi:HAE1 family hydrophobic/amphiphilic exporter-1